MDDQVGAERNRVLQSRRQEGVVHRQQGAAGPGDCGHGLQVDNAQQGVGRRLDENQSWRTSTRISQCGFVALVDEQNLEMPLLRKVGKQSKTATVAVVWRNQQVAGFEQLQHKIDGRHAGRCHYSACAALQSGQCLGQCIARGISGARVVVFPAFAEACEGEI